MGDKNSALAIIGTGATTVYLLKHIYDQLSHLKMDIGQIVLFEKANPPGMGMPYSPLNTDRFNLANISSEEIPELNETFAGWLENQEKGVLEGYGLEKSRISRREVYSRLALGAYFSSQYRAFVEKIGKSGIEVKEFSSEEIIDIRPKGKKWELVSVTDRSFEVNKVIIATGHSWKDGDAPEKRYFASPWPIFKIIPGRGAYYNYPIGILGASLSAFDVVTSLSHRHGRFVEADGRTVFEPAEGTEDFKLIMHDANGWLPHLQYEQAEPMREIYRHVDREGLLDLLDSRGDLRIDTFFDKICRPALREALVKDGLIELADALDSPNYGLEDFVDRMSERHEHGNAFEGMGQAMVEATRSVENNRPIHWKEVVDDLMFCLNYHAELLPAEDHLFFHKVVMPFLMNVIAALPLASARILLALYDAGKLELRSGTVEILQHRASDTVTRIKLTREKKTEIVEYRMFICCGGQRNIDLGDYPFPSLAKLGLVRPARAPIRNRKRFDAIAKVDEGRVVRVGQQYAYLTGGIDIDAAYRIIGKDGEPNENIHDVSFAHSMGLRPYSYGLQACSATTEIMVTCWSRALETGNGTEGVLEQVSKVYRDSPNI